MTSGLDRGVSVLEVLVLNRATMQLASSETSYSRILYLILGPVEIWGRMGSRRDFLLLTGIACGFGERCVRRPRAFDMVSLWSLAAFSSL